MVVNNICLMAGKDAQDKAFIAFERRGADDVRGVYFVEFDKTGTALNNTDDVFSNATRIIEPGLYGSLNLKRIWLYSNTTGDKITITIATEPEANKIKLLTGRIENNNFIACDAVSEIDTDNIDALFGFYYNDGTKNKFMIYTNSDGEMVGRGEGH